MSSGDDGHDDEAVGKYLQKWRGKKKTRDLGVTSGQRNDDEEPWLWNEQERERRKRRKRLTRVRVHTDLCGKMKCGKAVSPDDVSVEAWKCLEEIAVEFSSLSIKKMPEKWRSILYRISRIRTMF